MYLQQQCLAWPYPLKHKASSTSYLLRQEAVHDKYQGTLQAVEDGKNIRHHCRALMKQESSKHPHQAQYAHLGYGGHCESSAGEEEDEEST